MSGRVVPTKERLSSVVWEDAFRFRLLHGECAVYVFPKALDRVAVKLRWRISRRIGLPLSAFASFELSKVPRKCFYE